VQRTSSCPLWAKSGHTSSELLEQQGNVDAERLGGLEIYNQFDFLNVAVFGASPPTGKFCSQIATVKSNNLRAKAAFQEDA
jgi:hypothetical protein